MKRLVVCCDGTWQELSSTYPSNVVKISQAVKPLGSDGVSQIVFYDEGIGTEDSLKSKLFGGAFGKGIDTNIQDAYRFLCLNYAPGDEIYLFGFSRGAYTVRSLAGMIYNSGLLSRIEIDKAPEAYEMYRSRDIKPNHQQMVAFREKYGESVPITLLGCWDTVGSLGIPNLSPFLRFDKRVNKRYRFHDTSLSPIIEHGLHAVSIDEQRKVFDVTPMDKSHLSQTQVVREVWFPGVHGSVGGGSQEQSGLSDGPLQWMIESIGKIGLGLEFDPSAIPTGINLDYEIDFNNDLGLFKFTGRKLREISDNFDDLHESVIERWMRRPDYRPSNLAQKHGSRLNQLLEQKQQK
ncbi:MAG: DUF2235 domain-containing protein [Moorea sp. SIO3I7]|uniref:DUF2235 domain-containing protein n=1 Tax=unclassified Moorena TaxID=2683338 RepID=UPI0013C605BA|nr:MULTISPECIES: DUF2235 domain-containing protein [unclassified Moorena]NEO01432.1 DUF2235 domain-containing protein [Moorena sp. SIO3I7]NEO13623.1 DUF2235 domain-containing protein [Moorena sp. SIO3E8]NEO24542.1 DUF2235 domain-containing protein [Moorena sp. SIO4A5]NEQ00047.1 DUF2235 domain-containing protein [Moorena sp. SIO3F7]